MITPFILIGLGIYAVYKIVSLSSQINKKLDLLLKEREEK